MIKKYIVRPVGASLTSPLTATFRTRWGAKRYMRTLRNLGVEPILGWM